MKLIKKWLYKANIKWAKAHGKTGVHVTVWKNLYGKGKRIDIADIKPGMYVKEIPEFRMVTGTYTEDEFDYMIPIEGKDGTDLYSPLCLM